MRRQHHKGRKRPRSWHRGAAQGLVDGKKLKLFERAEKRAAQLDAEVAAIAAVGRLDTDAWVQLEHASPHVYHPWGGV